MKLHKTFIFLLHVHYNKQTDNSLVQYATPEGTQYRPKAAHKNSNITKLQITSQNTHIYFTYRIKQREHQFITHHSLNYFYVNL